MRTKKRVEVSFMKVIDMPELEYMLDNVIYISDEYVHSAHKCICGCGTKIDMPLNDGMWRYQIDTNNKISMQPSVGNYQIPCKSHYIFYKGGANFV